MDDFNWIVLDSLFRHKHVTLAAQDLYLSQSTLSRRLQQIEDEFGFIIAERTPKGLIFTSLGQNLARAAQEQIAWRNKLKMKFTDIDSNNIIHVGSTPYFEHNLLIPFEVALHKVYPELKIKFLSGKSYTLIKYLMDRIINIAFVRNVESYHGERLLIESSNVYIISRDPIKLEDLVHLSRIEYLPQDQKISQIIETWWYDNFSVPPRIGLFTSNINVIIRMVEKGNCYGIIPFAPQNEQWNELFKIPVKDCDGKVLTKETWMIYNSIEKLSDQERQFVDFVKPELF